MPTLDELYKQTIENQKKHLFDLQEEFNKKCDAIKNEALEKLKTIPKEDKEAREAVLVEQKQKLQEALEWLKNEVNTSTRDTMKKLEELHKEREKAVLADLEKQMLMA